jgi:membrane-associated phospholipid phosphatase
MTSTPTAAARPEVARPVPAPAAALDRGRTLRASAVCATAFAVLAGVVLVGWSGPLDDLGRPLAAEASEEGLWPVLRAVELAFAAAGITLLTVALVVGLLLRGAPRGAAYVACVAWSASAATTGLKALLGRDRPEWQSSEHLHTSLSFPSGHATSTSALAVTVVVLAWTSARTRRTQVAATVLVAWPGAVAVVLVAADRVLLGRHFPTDVVGGVLVGTAVALLWAGLLGLGRRGGTDEGVNADTTGTLRP